MLLTGARVTAVASLRLKHVDLIDGRVVQDAREVNTKASKTFDTYFFPVGDDIRAIVAAWVSYLRIQKLMGHDDPLFPATRMDLGQNRQLEPQGLARTHWSDGEPIRRIFQDAFRGAGLPYFNPHAFRRTLAMLGEQLCRTPEEFKAWSQNLGHEEVLTTFVSYGEVSSRARLPSCGTWEPSRNAHQGQLIEIRPSLYRCTGESTRCPMDRLCRIWLHEFHPLCDLFPAMEGKEFSALVLDIKMRGLRMPIMKMGDLILDGRHRYRACKEAGVEPLYEEYTGADPLGYVVSADLHRRHLNSSQRAMVAARLANMPQGARTDREPSANLQKVSQPKAANLLNVSPRSVADAKKVIERGTPELARRVNRGEIKVSLAAKVSGKPEEQQTGSLGSIRVPCAAL